MFTITTTKTTTPTGAGRVVAKGHGKQRTVNWDHSKSADANFGAAAGALLNVLTDDRQQAMLRHPSGGQRVRVTPLTEAGGRHRFEVNV